MRQIISELNYTTNDYNHNSEAYQKLLYYYHNLPDYRPHQEWYDKVIKLVADFYKKV